MDPTNTGAPAAQAANGAQPQVGASQAQAADAQKSQADGAENESSTVDVAQVTREREEARREAQSLRNRLKAFEDAKKAADDAKLSDAERSAARQTELETENSDLKRQLREERTRNRIVGAAQRLGYADPSDAFRLIDHSTLEYDDAGEPRHVDKLLGDLLKTKPYLASAAARATGSVDGGVRSPSTGEPDINSLIRHAAGRT
jgi:hypothetical protein